MSTDWNDESSFEKLCRLLRLAARAPEIFEVDRIGFSEKRGVDLLAGECRAALQMVTEEADDHEVFIDPVLGEIAQSGMASAIELFRILGLKALVREVGILDIATG